eukprot:TRINITY_DN6160_c0_g1_i1.p2 TRINITY_DN6160_c0_g1~~TRINITY_DN6160_c0_g1_i1.p2  ORF type:complete len:303 (-),score=76.42 TRINITY_DN6160_c0_g1_i1:34-942(-)
MATDDTSGFADAQAAAAAADATIIVVGLDQSQESEGHDRYSIDLPGLQTLFISAVAEASRGPVIVVVMAGGSVDLTVPATSDLVSAILWVGYPGQSGGQAVADIVFGDVNPSGRLPYTMYDSEYVDEVSMFDMNMRPGKASPGRTYRFYTGKPVYEFGFGLSYTTFAFKPSVSHSAVLLATVQKYLDTAAMAGHFLAPQSHSADYTVVTTVNVTVTNTGKVGGAVSVPVFMVPPQVTGAPIKYLFGFDKTWLGPGQSQEFSFPVQAHDFTVTNVKGGREALAGNWFIEIADADTRVPIAVSV